MKRAEQLLEHQRRQRLRLCCLCGDAAAWTAVIHGQVHWECAECNARVNARPRMVFGARRRFTREAPEIGGSPSSTGAR